MPYDLLTIIVFDLAGERNRNGRRINPSNPVIPRPLVLPKLTRAQFNNDPWIDRLGYLEQYTDHCGAD